VNFENSIRMKRDRTRIHSTAELIRIEEAEICGLYRLLTRGEARLSSLEKLLRRANTLGGRSEARLSELWKLHKDEARPYTKWPQEIHRTAELIRMEEAEICGLYRLLTRGEARLSSLEKIFRRANSVEGWSEARLS
jgi:intergrase/recombinase